MRQLRKAESKTFFREVRKSLEVKRDIYLLLENIQYARNVAAIFRTADAAGVKRIYLTGISQQPPFGKELRQASRNKEQSLEWMYEKDTGKVIQTLARQGFTIVALEVTDDAIPIKQLASKLKDKTKICLIAGSEVYGVKNTTLERVDLATYIPMYGKGASLNVGVSVGIALYSLD